MKLFLEVVMVSSCQLPECILHEMSAPDLELKHWSRAPPGEELRGLPSSKHLLMDEMVSLIYNMNDRIVNGNDYSQVFILIHYIWA